MGRAERDARLQELQEATEAWADKRIEQYEAQVTFNEALLKGRTGSERLAQSNVQAGSELVVESIGAFLLA